MTDPIPPKPKQRAAPSAPVSEVEKLMRALTRVILEAEGTPFKHVSRDVIQEDMVPADQMPAVIFDDSRLTYTYQDAHNRDRIAHVSGTIVFDVQGTTRSHGGRETGFAVGQLRNALVHALSLILYNNRRMVVQLPECGETTPEAHCQTIGAQLDVQHIPVAPPLTRSLVSATVTLVETLDQRAWVAWRAGELEAAPFEGALVTASINPDDLDI